LQQQTLLQQTSLQQTSFIEARKSIEEAFGRRKGRWRIRRIFKGFPDASGINHQNGALRDVDLILNGAIGSFDSTQVKWG
jgi:hypothetical protein